MKIFHHSRFHDSGALAALKRNHGLRVSVCIPTLDEADTIGVIVSCIRKELMDTHGVVDEVIVIDSGSTDATRDLARAAGADVYLSAEIAPESGTFRGKGENLWKALHVATGDLICFVDGDIANFDPHFVTGLVGPLLEDPSLCYVKAFYERPLDHPQGFRPTGGGRVTEILVRPLLSLFYPELTAFLQPLSGEYAARRETFRSLLFPCGYGVELAHLIDLSRTIGPDAMAQTDLDQRHHRNRSDEELGRMAFGILQVLFRRLERDGKLTLASSLPEILQTWHFDGLNLAAEATAIPEPERPAFAK
ncbi:glucosyl-3-phosphoglycerate synthase [Luteolibacter ambystomatis]|uniref:Glucosyl-3-phosphoglycerate synthase n=1 Tax=Luteolibacter ambystomatis TaxID=2824561 RepID=A0A975J2J7_9BACT|nr:glucosyl-3-phosphoglycerate synthase [Luteolibacter ambystomatis]QUE52865.1 glucosyl-3-phosphoglycerate synthase [Luteolibacter ambystomatis]